jgi:hypothetical protein
MQCGGDPSRSRPQRQARMARLVPVLTGRPGSGGGRSGSAHTLTSLTRGPGPGAGTTLPSKHSRSPREKTPATHRDRDGSTERSTTPAGPARPVLNYTQNPSSRCSSMSGPYRSGSGFLAPLATAARGLAGTPQRCGGLPGKGGRSRVMMVAGLQAQRRVHVRGRVVSRGWRRARPAEPAAALTCSRQPSANRLREQP